MKYFQAERGISKPQFESFMKVGHVRKNRRFSMQLATASVIMLRDMVMAEDQSVMDLLSQLNEFPPVHHPTNLTRDCKITISSGGS